MVRVAAFLTVFVVCALPADLAQAAPGDDKASSAGGNAKEIYKRAKTHYQLGEYREALQDFKEAYRLKQEPVLLFNIAQCHRLLREYSDALRSYQGYLRDAESASNRDEVERMIRDLKKVVDSTPAPAPMVNTPPPAPTPTPVVPPTPPAETVTPAPTPPVVDPAAPAVPVVAAAPAPITTTVSPPAPSIAPPIAFPTASEARDAELQVIGTAPDADVLINQSVVSRNSHATIRLPPGLYNVAITKEDYRGAEGAVVLMAGDRQSLTGEVKPLKSHGWRKWGITFFVLAAVCETAAQVLHHEANKRFTGSEDFNRFSGEKVSGGVALTTGILGALFVTIDILRNSDRVEAGPPSLLLPTAPGGATP